MDKIPNAISYKFDVWDIVCDKNNRHMYIPQVNTGAVVEKVLYDWNLILKDCYGIHNYENFILKKNHRPKFMKWDTVMFTNFPTYYDRWPCKFVVKKVEGTAVYYGSHRFDFYLEDDLKLMQRWDKEVNLPFVAAQYIIIGILIGYLLGKYL